MEDKSIDQLRLEAQELYQAKLRAYNEAQKNGVTEPQKVLVKEPVKIKTAQSPIKPLSPPAFEEIQNVPNVATQKPSGTRHSWFVVTVFSILLIVVFMEVFMLKS